MNRPSVPAKVPVLAIALAAVSPHLQAQQLYVADKLVINVYAEANQSSSRVATIETGDTAEEIERIDNFVHVRLPDGRQGWVGANYVSAQPPAIVRLKELEAGQPVSAGPSKQQTDEIARLQKQNATLTAEVKELKKKASAVVAPSPAAVAAAPAVNESVTPAALAANEPVEAPESAPTVIVQRSYWWAWLIAVIVTGGAGFYAGYQTLGRRVRERFGGVKVY